MLLGRLRQTVPWFIGLFIVASLMNTAGLVGHAAPMLQDAARFVLVLAMAAVGLQGHWRSFAGAGLRPAIIGFGAWAAVALTSLAVQGWTAQL
jgi:uncharacterized membrane protein YadS